MTSEVPPRVVEVSDPDLLNHLQLNPGKFHAMFQKSLPRLFEKDTNLEQAWKNILGGAKRVGIKIHTGSGMLLRTRPELLEAVLEGLMQSGIRPANIVIFDRYRSRMEDAGYSPTSSYFGCRMQAIVPDSGYDANQVVDLPYPGKLIWGDYEFQPKENEEESAVSTMSHFSRILTRDIDALIVLSVPLTHPGYEYWGAQLSGSVGLIDNFRRFQNPSPIRDDLLQELFHSEVLKNKIVLHIMDASLIQFAGGPQADPAYFVKHQTLYLSQNGAAIDTLLVKEINRYRPGFGLRPIHPGYLKPIEDTESHQGPILIPVPPSKGSELE